MPFNLRDIIVALPWRRAARLPADTTIEEDLADEDLVEIMNLREANTGVPGDRPPRGGPSRMLV